MKWKSNEPNTFNSNSTFYFLNLSNILFKCHLQIWNFENTYIFFKFESQLWFYLCSLALYRQYRTHYLFLLYVLFYLLQYHDEHVLFHRCIIPVSVRFYILPSLIYQCHTYCIYVFIVLLFDLLCSVFFLLPRFLLWDKWQCNHPIKTLLLFFP